MAQWRAGDVRGPAAKGGCLGALTPREKQVLRALAHGLSDLQIAASLCLYESAVRTHVRRVLRKLGIVRAQAPLSWMRCRDSRNSREEPGVSRGAAAGGVYSVGADE